MSASAQCPSCRVDVPLADDREEYLCRACMRWSRRESVDWLLELKSPIGLTLATGYLTFKIGKSLWEQTEALPFEAWGPLLLAPLGFVLGTAFTIRGIRKRLAGRKLIPVER